MVSSRTRPASASPRAPSYRATKPSHQRTYRTTGVPRSTAARPRTGRGSHQCGQRNRSGPVPATGSGHLTILQRSPSYVGKVLPDRWVTQAKTQHPGPALYMPAGGGPGRCAALLLTLVRRQVGKDFDLTHFTPTCMPETSDSARYATATSQGARRPGTPDPHRPDGDETKSSQIRSRYPSLSPLASRALQ
jgi:hypothetical protein